MKAFLWIGGVVLALLLFILWLSSRSSGSESNGIGESAIPKQGREMEIISHEEAVQLARNAVGKIEIPSDVEPVVVFSKEKTQYTVTFPITLPERVRGPDYYAEVTLDARTGKVLQALGGR